MARIFKQRDIEQIDPSNIPAEFVEYYHRLSAERQQAILASRPDLLAGLERAGEGENPAPETEERAAEEEPAGDGREAAAVQPEEETPGREEPEEDDEEDEFELIRQNAYEHIDLECFIGNDMVPLEALAIEDDPKHCPLHRTTAVRKKQIKYHTPTGGIYGVVFYHCPACRRLYMEESKMELVHRNLSKLGVEHTLYDLGLTNRYLQSRMPSHVFSREECIYVPELWVEENPVCPVHGAKLSEIPCQKIYNGKKVSFTGYICNSCQKIMLRRSRALDLEDLCAEQGIPLIEYKSIAKKTPEKKAVPAKSIKPDYFLQEGKRVAYTYTHIADCYKLTEGDTVIVSDSVYCGLEGHDTETVLGLIWVKERSGTRKSYLFMLGYCAECRKYYMDSADYKTVYRLGRPEVTILLDLGRSDYQITSGEVFDLERNHLQKLEGEIQGEIDGIRSQPDYISQYAVQDGAGPYDDGTLRYAKSVSREKYEPRLEELFGYTDRPYEYRVDIVADGRTEVYYVGAADISLGHQKKVISANSSLGRELVHYQTIKVTKEGKEYDIKLSRQFDIAHRSLYGYVNLRTDEDIIFRRGVTDPFLVRVLNMRKKQHNLIDIFVTIQENQNAIVDAPFRQNLIVQGCAGSGKTMVMLHRLSSLKYNQRSFDFGRAMILTPNEQFSLHIKGLAEGLQIGGIVRTSVEEYYIRMLAAYAPEFRPGKELASELGENQRLVDYIYSDRFLSDFEAAYQRVIAERNTLVRLLDALAEEMQETPREVDLSQDAVVIPQIRMALDGLEAKIRPKERAIQEAKAEYDRMTARKQFLEERLPEVQKFAEFVVRDVLPRVYTKISVVSSETQRSVGAAKEQVQRFMEEREHLRKSLNPFGKQAKLSAVDKKIQAEEQKLNTELARQEKQTSLFGMETAEMSDEEVLAWMGQVVLYVPEIREEIRFCKRGKEEWERITAEYSGIDAGIAKADMDYQKAVSQGYSGEVTGAIAHLREQLRRYSPVNTLHLVFSEATAAFKNEIGLKSVRGKYHRYDLYAALVFAMKFFNRAVGTAEFMCIDEGQDLALNEYRLIYKLNQEKVVFNIYGDTNQLIKPGRGIRDWAELRKRIEAEVFTLNENYRNTNQITRFCNDSFGMDVMQTGVDGAKVREIPRKDLEGELSALSITTERIAILVPRSVQKKSYLHSDQIASEINHLIGEEMENGRISLMYVDEVKGIEFDKVFVVDNKMSRNEKYIAYTRALSELILVVDEKIEAFRAEEEKAGVAKKSEKASVPKDEKWHALKYSGKKNRKKADPDKTQATENA